MSNLTGDRPPRPAAGLLSWCGPRTIVPKALTRRGDADRGRPNSDTGGEFPVAAGGPEPGQAGIFVRGFSPVSEGRYEFAISVIAGFGPTSCCGGPGPA